MLARATTTIDILRDTDDPGTESDDYYGGYGDTDEDDAEPINERPIPASIIEKTQRALDATQGGMVSVTYTVGRVGGNVDVKAGDRIHDRRDGRKYAVVSVHQPQSPTRLLDKRLELEHV